MPQEQRHKEQWSYSKLADGAGPENPGQNGCPFLSSGRSHLLLCTCPNRQTLVGAGDPPQPASFLSERRAAWCRALRSFHEQWLRSAALLEVRLVVIPGAFDLEAGSTPSLYLSHTLYAATGTVTVSHIPQAIMGVSNHYINALDLVLLNVIKLLPYQWQHSFHRN